MLTWLSELPGVFHLFRYLTFRTLGAAGTGLFLVFFFGPATIIDESYNANPASMRAALALLAAAKPGPKGRRIAVIGDMLELGPKAARA